MKMVDPSSLHEHPLSVSMFPPDADHDETFANDIRGRGVQVPLQVLPDGRHSTDGVPLPEGTVIMGHRRRRYAIQSRIGKVPVVVRHDLCDPEEIELAMLCDNDERLRRTLTNEQKTRMAMRIEQLERQRRKKHEARAPRGSGSRLRVDAQAAEQVGMSRNTYRKARDVVGRIDEAEKTGDTQRAGALRSRLNRSVHGAAKAGVPSKAPQGGVRDSLAHVEQALKATSKSVQKAQAAHGGPSVHSRAVVSALHVVYEKIDEWKRDL